MKHNIKIDDSRGSMDNLDRYEKGSSILLLRSNTYTLAKRGDIGKILFVDEAGSVHVDINGKHVSLNRNSGDDWELL
ncbi:hypothetical protein J2S74_002954 [Evansella vedderi]|uniref:Uncharacterized protein n=1 Tax=Evansella vedderi TaxID=38282 RepID=A0ABT9ZWH7_9BACI|nr:hypothetical protein [Evansella vedderi]MDQ0255572.1 hypothetical protein [Evansella vedderi]